MRVTGDFNQYNSNGMGCGNDGPCYDCQKRKLAQAMGFDINSFISPIAQQVDQFVSDPIGVITGRPLPTTQTQPVATQTPSTQTTAATAAALASQNQTTKYLIFAGIGVVALLALYVLLPGKRGERVVIREVERAPSKELEKTGA